MEIRNYIAGGALKIHLAGRLDAFWSRKVSQHLDQAIQDGHRHIRLNLADLLYLSSAGIETLLRYHAELARLQGSFEISNPSDTVRKVLSLSGLNEMLSVPAPALGESRLRTRMIDGAHFSVTSSSSDAAIRCQVVRAASQAECRQVTCWKDILVVGVGSLAGGTEWEHFGPLFAVSGAALCQPSDAHETPDYMVTAENFTPELTLRTGMACKGALTTRAAFNARMSLGELGNAALEILGSDMGAMTVIGNTGNGEPMMAAGIAVRGPSQVQGSGKKPLVVGRWPNSSFGSAIFSGEAVGGIDGEATTAVARFFKSGGESRVPQRIFFGSDASSARFSNGCIFAGAISSFVGLPQD
jgi:anti-anti-sigma factor